MSDHHGNGTKEWFKAKFSTYEEALDELVRRDQQQTEYWRVYNKMKDELKEERSARALSDKLLLEARMDHSVLGMLERVEALLNKKEEE